MQCKTFISLLNGILVKEGINAKNSNWTWQRNRKIASEKEKELAEKYESINHQIIITSKTDEKQILVHKYKLNDPTGQQKVQFMRNHGIDFGDGKGFNIGEQD